MKPSNRTRIQQEAQVEISGLRIVEFALVGMGLVIAAMSLGVYLTISM